MFEHLTDENCQARFGRSAPWHEIVEASSLEDVAWRLGGHAGAPTLDIHAAFRAVWAWMRPPREGCCWRGWTEPLRLAVPRLGMPREGPVYLVRDPYETRAMLIDLSELIFFEDLLWGDDSKVVDVNASWALFGRHDWEGQFADFRPRNR